MAAAHAQAPVGAAPDERAISAGRWAVVSVEWDGKPVNPDFLALPPIMYAADGSWGVLFKSVMVAEGRSTNHQEQSPKTFEMETLGSEGIKPTWYGGIYRLDADVRVLCIAPPSGAMSTRQCHGVAADRKDPAGSRRRQQKNTPQGVTPAGWNGQF